MQIFLIISIAVSLSMDAFSLSLAYGTLNLTKKNIYSTSIIVGIYHFIMPLLGSAFGSLLLRIIPIRPNVIVFIVLIFIGIQMIIEGIKGETEIKSLTLIEQLLFGLAVSIDSFSVGIGMSSISGNYLLCAFVFSISSLAFTYAGLNLGKRINKIIGNISTIIGGSVLVIIGLFYFFK